MTDDLRTYDATTHVTMPIEVAQAIDRALVRLQVGNPDVDLDHERAVLHAAMDARWTL